MPTTQSESISNRGEFIRSVGEGSISFDKITLVSGQNLKAGTVLGKITASGKYTLHDNAASDGSQAAVAILYQDTDATDGDVPATAVMRLAEVVDSLLTFKDGISAPNRAAAITNLAASNIFAR